MSSLLRTLFVVLALSVGCMQVAHASRGSRYPGSSRGADVMVDSHRGASPPGDSMASFRASSGNEGGPSFPREPRSTSTLLHDHGLGTIASFFAGFIELFDSGTHFFTRLNDDAQFDVLNKFIYAFVKSFSVTLYEVTSAKDAPSNSDTIDYVQMRDFLSRQEINLRNALVRDPAILESEWAQFIGKIHIIFDQLAKLYKMALDNYVSLSWFVMGLLGTFLTSTVPEDAFNRETFAELLLLPASLKDTLHEALEHLLTSDYAPMLKMFANVATGYLSQRAMAKGDEL